MANLPKKNKGGEEKEGAPMREEGRVGLKKPRRLIFD